MKNEPLISVIIPIYNVSEYIDACVTRIINQTYNNLEIILVDDGSNDDCPKKCDKYASLDKRVRVIHKSNGGLSDARNAAIDICTGDYITFVDSDDSVSFDYVETLYRVLHQNDCEISICNYQAFSSEIPAERISIDQPSIYSSKDAIIALLAGDPFTTSAWGKLYARRLFSDIRYPKGMIYEDLPTTWKAVSKVKKVVYTPSIKYYYRQNPTSITNSSFTSKKLDVIKAHELVLQEIKDVFPELVVNVRERLGCYASTHLFYAFNSSFQNRGALKEMQNHIKKNIRPLLNSRFPAKIKLFAICMNVDFIFNAVCRLKCRQ